MKTILVPTDFSKNAENALDYAIELSKKEKAKIILLHAYSDVSVIVDAPIQLVAEQIKIVQREAGKHLNVLRARVEKAGKINCELINLEGFAVDVILDIIKRKKVDLVVMGTKGASGIKEVLIGSNTAKVIAKSLCPVIAVPEKAVFEGIKKITYATDYQASDLVALKQLVKIAAVFRSQVNVLHITDGEYNMATEEEFMKEFMQKANKKIDYNNISYQLIQGKGNEIDKQLEKYLKEKSTNLLAISTRYRNLIDKVFAKSITKKLVLHTTVPMIVFHYKQEPVVLI